jgi:hypothetical protein
MQILPHLFASGLLFFLCLRHCPSFSSSTHVAHLLSGVMDVFSVIRRTPHEFKIACLQDIRSLFPEDCNPFYAGFGNRDTDEISYLKVGIPKGKVFIINPRVRN